MSVSGRRRSGHVYSLPIECPGRASFCTPTALRQHSHRHLLFYLRSMPNDMCNHGQCQHKKCVQERSLGAYITFAGQRLNVSPSLCGMDSQKTFASCHVPPLHPELSSNQNGAKLSRIDFSNSLRPWEGECAAGFPSPGDKDCSVCSVSSSSSW